MVKRHLIGTCLLALVSHVLGHGVKAGYGSQVGYHDGYIDPNQQGIHPGQSRSGIYPDLSEYERYVEQGGYGGHQGQDGYAGQSGHGRYVDHSAQGGFIGQTVPEGYIGQQGRYVEQPGQQGYIGQSRSAGSPGHSSVVVSFPAKENGTCFKRVPYNEALAMNISKGYIQEVDGTRDTNTRGYHEVTHFEPTCCDGYESLGFTLCSPICEKPCTDGSCSAPNTCSCDDGYALSQTDKSLCEPICHRPCVNGTCTAPDTCTCDRGYEFRYLSKFTCVPICTDCFIFEYCAEPGVCRCLQKYSRQTSLDRADTNVNFEKCKPVCQENCVNSKCIAPDLCECLPGYDISEDNPYACIPHCSTDCFNGKCTSPEICSCNEGYTQSLNSSSTCAPVCNENCVMGKCIEPDVCSCFEGYSLKNNSKYICEPICKEPCTNGTCSGPDTCTYTIGRNESKKSVNDATCSKTCKIGDATCIGGDWNCTCEEGYSYNKESENCKPICSTTCYNGLCTAPNTCTCLEGYRPQTDESLKHFSTICPNLDRDCFQGYRLDPKKVFEFCEPYCHTTCTNGFCSAPNTCTCNDGYQLKNDTNYGQICIPVCNCLNGYCNDTASACTMCEAGYELMDGDNSTFCKPFCQNGCQYGTCTAPNNCSCYSNWSGPSCDEPLTCIVTNSTHVEEYHILDNGFIINENVLNSDQSWNEPKCNEQCIDEINNATQCMNRTQIDGQNLTVCFIKIDSQCNLLNTMADSGNLRSTKPVILASVTLSVVLVVAIISAIIALIIRKRRNDRAAMPMARAKLQQDFLIENDGVYL